MSRRRFGAGGDHETGPGAQTPSASKAGGGGGGGGGGRRRRERRQQWRRRARGVPGRRGRRVRRYRKRGRRGAGAGTVGCGSRAGTGRASTTGGVCEPSGSMSAENEKLMSEFSSSGFERASSVTASGIDTRSRRLTPVFRRTAAGSTGARPLRCRRGHPSGTGHAQHSTALGPRRPNVGGSSAPSQPRRIQ